MEQPETPPIPTTEDQTDQQQPEVDGPTNQQAALLAEPDQSATTDKPDASANDAYFKDRLEKAKKPEQPGNFDQGLRKTQQKLASQGEQISEVKAGLSRIEQLLEQQLAAGGTDEDDLLPGDDDDYLTRKEGRDIIRRQNKLAQSPAPVAPATPKPAPPQASQTVSTEQATQSIAVEVRKMFPAVTNVGGQDRAVDIVTLAMPEIQAYMARNPGLTQEAASDFAEKEIKGQIQQLIIDGVLPNPGSKKVDDTAKPKPETVSRNLVPAGAGSPTAITSNQTLPPAMNAAEAESRILSDPALQKLAREGHD